MSQLGTVYATKRRRRNGKSLKPPPKDGLTKSNPSKRHRERLNAELDLLASLLPFEQNILSKLDRLSILRLSVSYLRTKSYFQSVMHKDKDENGVQQQQQQQHQQQHSHHSHQQHPHNHSSDAYVGNRLRELEAIEQSMLEGDMFLQALNGFLMILSCDGEVFFATHSIESYLGFHQSDIVHQSVYELVHSEDREELQRQLLWNSFLPGDCAAMSLAETLAADRAHLLERSFTVRFRCLLDNTSGFLRLDIRGRVKIMHGQNRKCEEPPLGLFAYCTPFGPPSLLEIPQKENMFKSKHKLDFSLVSMDQRGKSILGFSDAELASMGGYDLVHFDDLAYVASAHQELLKTGASGMIAYRYQKKNNEWQWLQTSSRLVYKNSKPDFVICTHRQLMEEEGRDLLGKRTMDFKVSYLDTGLASTYFSESDQLVAAPSGSPNSLPPPTTPHKPTRRYKTQLRDFLSTCRSKRKLQQQQQHPHHPQQQSGQHGSMGQMTPPISSVTDYMPDPAAAVAAAYSNLGNPMYSSSPYAPNPSDNLYMSPVSSVHHHSGNYYPSVTDSMFHQYRLQGVGSYYPEYHHSAASTAVAATYAVTNGFLPYDSYSLPSASAGKSMDDKSSSWSSVGHHAQEASSSPSAKYYAASQHDEGGRASCAGGGGGAGVYAGYISPATPTATASASAAATSASAEAAASTAAALSAAAASSSTAASAAAAAHSTSSPSTSTQIQIHSTMKTPKPSPSSTTAAAAVAAAGTGGRSDAGLVVSIGPADTVSCSTESPAGPAANGSPAATNPRPRAASSSRHRPSAADALKSEHGHCGSAETFERQTVLMWGSTSNSNASSSNRSPNSTPTPNGTVYSHAQLVTGSTTSSVGPEHLQSNGRLSHGPKASSMTPSPADCSATSDHLSGKWNGSLHSHKADDDAAVQVYQITHLPTATEAAHTYRMQQQQQHQHAEQHGQPQQLHHHHQHEQQQQQQQQHMQHTQQMAQHHQQQQQLHGDGVVVVDSSVSANQSVGHQQTTGIGHHGPHATSIGGSCEVWSPSYSQYQYFTYHHAPQHASTQQSCSTHFNQHRSHHHHLSSSSAMVLDSSTSTPPSTPTGTSTPNNNNSNNNNHNSHNHSRYSHSSNTTTSNGGASVSLRPDSSRAAHRHYHPVQPHQHHHPHPHRPQSQQFAVGSVHPHLHQHPHFQQQQQQQQQYQHHPGHHHHHHRSLSAGVLCYPSLR